VGPGPAEVTATITAAGVLTVWGLPGEPLVVDEGAPAPARNALINLLQQHAAAAAGPVRAAVRTPAGPWYMAVDGTGRCIPQDPADFTAPAPDLDPATVLAGADAVLAAAAAGPPQATLALASDPDPVLRARALAELATWPDDQDAVADAQLPGQRLEVLARCALPWVRAGVAANPGTDPATLADLVADPDPTVRLALAARFDLEPAVTVQLAGDGDDRVRTELARNPAAAFLAPARHAAAPVPVGGGAGPDGPGPEPQDPANLTGTAAGDPGHDGPDAPPPPVLDPSGHAAQAARPRRSRRALVAVTAAAALGVGGYAAAALPSPAAPPPPPAATADPAGVLWNGIVLPVGPDGPADPAGPVAAGFARTELGAALAAAHLSVRIDPLAGPASFEPTIAGRTVGGDPAALLAATWQRYQQAAAAAGVRGGGPVPPDPAGPARIAGWRTPTGWDPAGTTTVHLLVTDPRTPAGTDYAIAVRWSGDDWALLDPTADGTFTTSPPAPATAYRSFG
jgi:hypothetical protein